MFLPINQDVYVDWRFMRRADTGNEINAGTGVWTLREMDETQLATGAFMASGSDGHWSAVIPKSDTDSLVKRREYYIDLAISGSGGEFGFRRLQLRAKYQGAG